MAPFAACRRFSLGCTCIADLPIAALAPLASLLAGLATGVGAAGVYAVRAIGERLRDRLLGFAAMMFLDVALG